MLVTSITSQLQSIPHKEYVCSDSLFLNFDLTTLIWLNSRSTSAFECGKERRQPVQLCTVLRMVLTLKRLCSYTLRSKSQWYFQLIPTSINGYFSIGKQFCQLTVAGSPSSSATLIISLVPLLCFSVSLTLNRAMFRKVSRSSGSLPCSSLLRATT